MAGKAGRWLRSFFVTGSRKGRKAKDRNKQADGDTQSVSSSAALPTPASTPPARDKRRWSFRRPAASAVAASKDDAAGAASGGQGPLAPSSSQCFSEAEVHVVMVQDHQHAVAVTVPESAATFVPLPPPVLSEGSDGGDGRQEAAAAIKIQSAFRSYLARKALCALRGMVKLQAMVRCQLVRRQANATLRRMKALVDAQMRARAERLRLLEDDDGRQLATTTTPRQPPGRRSPRHARSRKAVVSAVVIRSHQNHGAREKDEVNVAVQERSSEESVKIVEVDDGGDAHGAPRAVARRGGSCYSTPSSRTPVKPELYQKVSPTTSALTDASARTLSGRFDDAWFTSASETSRRNKAWRADHAPPFPSYMTNTESSRAKARSQSAPRQRFAASESAAASPSPSCGERPPSGSGSGGAWRRASLDLLGARAAAHWSSSSRVERCASRARARAGVGASLPSSECGSSAWRD